MPTEDADDEEQPARVGMKLGRNFENVIDVERKNASDQQAQRADAAISEERGIDQLGKVLLSSSVAMNFET